MDVKHVLFYKLPTQTRLVIYDYAKIHRKDIPTGSDWKAIDKWFLDNYNAVRREGGAPQYTFSDPEKYTEFCLKWM